MWPFSKKPTHPKVEDALETRGQITDHAPGSQGPTVTIGRGRECPNCGEHKFRADGAIYRCNNRQCQAVGFYSRPGKTGRGPGSTCPSCKKMCLHGVGHEPRVLWCSHCNLVSVGKERKTVTAHT